MVKATCNLPPEVDNPAMASLYWQFPVLIPAQLCCRYVLQPTLQVNVIRAGLLTQLFASDLGHCTNMVIRGGTCIQ